MAIPCTALRGLVWRVVLRGCAVRLLTVRGIIGLLSRVRRLRGGVASRLCPVRLLLVGGIASLLAITKVGRLRTD